MRTIKTAMLRALLIATTTTTLPILATASGGVKLKPTSNNAMAIVSLAEIDAERVTLSIENKNKGMLYYSERIANSSDFQKLFDFSSLDDGNYVILVDTYEEVIEKPLVINNSKVVLEEPKRISKPVFRIKNNALFVFHNAGAQDEIVISFYGEDGKFFSEELNDNEIARKYDISLLRSGRYSVSLKTENDFFTHQFDIR